MRGRDSGVPSSLTATRVRRVRLSRWHNVEPIIKLQEICSDDPTFSFESTFTNLGAPFWFTTCMCVISV